MLSAAGAVASVAGLALDASSSFDLPPWGVMVAVGGLSASITMAGVWWWANRRQRAVRPIRSEQETTEVLEDLIRKSKTSICLLRVHNLRLPSTYAALKARLAKTDPPRVYRAIVLSNFSREELEHHLDDLRASFRGLEECEVRFLYGYAIGMNVAIVDGRRALLGIPGGSGKSFSGALLVRDETLVALLQSAFQQMWDGPYADIWMAANDRVDEPQLEERLDKALEKSRSIERHQRQAISGER